MTRILLKCRPTPAQLADRLAPPGPDGLELYLAAEDLAGPDWLARTVDLLARFDRPPGFALLVEGPVRSLDGEFFDLTRETPANLEVVRRVAALGQALGAAAANVHAIAPATSPAALGPVAQRAALAASLPLLRHHARSCQESGLVPLIENMPPVARMREGGYWYTPIGMAAADLRWLADAVPGVAFTVDLSHAQLYLNARRADPSAWPRELAPLLRFLRSLPDPRPTDAADVAALADYVAALGDRLVSAHVANASGLLGEGLPYGEGDADLDAVAARLLGRAAYLVTETLDPDPERARQMREAQARLLAVRAGWSAGGPAAASRGPRSHRGERPEQTSQ